MARSKCMLNDVRDRLGRALTGFSGRPTIVRAVQAALLWLTAREGSTSKASGVERERGLVLICLLPRDASLGI